MKIRGWNQWYGGIPRCLQRSSGSCECGEGATCRGHFIDVMQRGWVVIASGISGDVTTPGLLTRGVVAAA